MILSAVPDVDPLERFIRALPDAEPMRLQQNARETVRLREELLAEVTKMLQADRPIDAMGHAEWIANNVRTVAYRWTTLVLAAKAHARIDYPVTVVTVRADER
jgi:hypothetical protein